MRTRTQITCRTSTKSAGATSARVSGASQTCLGLSEVIGIHSSDMSSLKLLTERESRFRFRKRSSCKLFSNVIPAKSKTIQRTRIGRCKAHYLIKAMDRNKQEGNRSRPGDPCYEHLAIKIVIYDVTFVWRSIADSTLQREIDGVVLCLSSIPSSSGMRCYTCITVDIEMI